MNDEAKIYTSYHNKASALRKAGFFVVSISRYQPKYNSPSLYDLIELRLAPHSYMLKMDAAEYDVEFAKILDGLDAQKMWDSLQDEANFAGKRNIALLCYEKDRAECHRSKVAHWFREQIGKEVEEWVDETAKP